MNLSEKPLINGAHTLVLLALTGGLICHGQTPVDKNTVLIGQCQGHEKEPGCVLPSVFGSTGLTLDPTIPHFAHFLGEAQTTLNSTFSTSIATQLTTLPIISPASGFTYRYDRASGAFVRTSDSFGPIYAERAETIGRGKVSFGVSYQRFRFGTLDGLDLHKIPAVFTHVDPGTSTAQPYHADVISTVNSISINMDQTMFYGTVGVTDRFDISVAIPISSVRVGIISYANIIRMSGVCFTPNPNPDGTIISGNSSGCPTGQLQDPHSFNPTSAFTTSPTTATYSSSGSASGIGDVTLRFKANLIQSDKVRVAAALDLRTPSGDPRKFLGSGATGVKPFVAISMGKRISPHANLGYQWNGKSILTGDVTGVTLSEKTPITIQNGDPIKDNLPGQFFYSIGADAGITNKLTVAFDYLGQTLFDAPRIALGSVTTNPANIPGVPGTTCPAKSGCVLPNVKGLHETYALNNGAIGLKYNFFGDLLLTADLLFRMDDHGLRQNVTPMVAVSYAFGR